MVRRRHGNNALANTLKDYLVPIIGGVIILVLIYSVFRGGSDAPETTLVEGENRIPLTVVFSETDTEANVVFSGNNQEAITDGYSLYMGERIIVKEGSVRLRSDAGDSIALNRVAEFSYEGRGKYSLSSSDAWIKTQVASTIDLSYASVDTPAGSIISLTQNEANSTIYVLEGSAKVTNLGGVDTMLVAGQKISIARQNAASEDINLEDEKSAIDTFFRSSDWFIENGGHLIQIENPESNTGTGSNNLGEGTFIEFRNLEDEMSVSGGSISIGGSVDKNIVGALSINNEQVQISDDGNFNLENLSLSSTLNDLVVKIYDTERNILEKRVYTVYANPDTVAAPPSTSSASIGGSSRVFEVDATDFGFTQPSSTGKFSTSASEVTIRGYTNAEGISQVRVNGFRLSSFNGSTWRYHAFERFETLEEGTNQYKVDYYGEDGTIVYTDYYTIVKQTSQASLNQSPASSENTPTSSESENEIISNEANPE